MLGASGEAYRLGIIVFGLMGASSSILIPFLFYYLGTKSWWLGKRFSYLTQIQMIRDRYTSPALGTLLFVVVVLLMLPYILIGVKGGGDALAAITHGEWPSWAGSLLVCGVTFLYVTYGGMRSTAWANTFQTTVFILVGIIAYLVIRDHYGGIGEAMATLRDTHPEFVIFGSGSYTVFKMLSYLLSAHQCCGISPYLRPLALCANRAVISNAHRILSPVHRRRVGPQRHPGDGRSH